MGGGGGGRGMGVWNFRDLLEWPWSHPVACPVPVPGPYHPCHGHVSLLLSTYMHVPCGQTHFNSPRLTVLLP